MIKKKEKIYQRKINGSFLHNEWRKKTSYLLFGFIPIYVVDEVIRTDEGGISNGK